MCAQYTVWVGRTKGDSGPRHDSAGPHKAYFHPGKHITQRFPDHGKGNYKKEKLLHREESMEKKLKHVNVGVARV